MYVCTHAWLHRIECICLLLSSGFTLSRSLSPHAQIAAASFEKLFQQLTSPQIFREDFTNVFLLTHSCFTTPKDILTTLVNCVKSFELEDSMSDTSSQVCMLATYIVHVFTVFSTCIIQITMGARSWFGSRWGLWPHQSFWISKKSPY